MCVCMCVYIYTCTHTNLFINTFTYTHTYIYIYRCMYIQIYIYIYTLKILDLHILSMSFDARPTKFQRLHELRRNVPYVSKVALEGILKDIESKGHAERHTTKAMLQATRADIARWNAYGALLTTSRVVDCEGSHHEMLHINLHSMLHAPYREGGSFANLLADKHEQNPSSMLKPWALTVYCDECWPGNALSAKSNKKSWCIYVTWKELGEAALAREDAWFPLLFQKSNFIGSLAGSMGQALRVVLVTCLAYCSCMHRACTGLLLICT